MNITPNQIITLTDIKSNPELWIQKFSIILFTDQNGKAWWTKEYKFLPHYERYNEAVKWIRDNKFPEYDCRIVKNENNEIEIVTKNYFGTIISHEQIINNLITRKIKPRIIKEINNLSFTIPDPKERKKYVEDLKSALKFTTYQEFYNFPYGYLYQEYLPALKQAEINKNKLTETDLEKVSYDFARPDLAILWRKQLYFITSFQYINNYKLTVQIRAKKCPLFLYYWNWMKARGTGIVEQAPKLIKQSEDNLMESSRLHYDFCDDLGMKRVYHNEMGYQPKFSLFMAQLNVNSGKLCYSEQKTKTADGQEGKQLIIPTNLKIKKCQNTKEEINKALSNSKVGLWGIVGNLVGAVFGTDGLKKLTEKIVGSKVHVSVGPEEHTDGNSFYSNMTTHQDVLFLDNKKIGEQYKEWFKKQPHLLDHTTFQFVFLNDIVMSANGQYLGIKYDKDKDQFILPYKIFINHSPGNLYYRWEMGHITIKCEVKTIGMFEDPYNPLRVIGNVSWSSPQVGGGWTTPGAGTGPWHAGGTSVGWNSESSMGDLEAKNKKSDKKEKDNNKKMFDNFKKDLNKSIDPSVFTADTINFNYSLGEFFNRLTDPVFFYRVYISQLLYNKLEKWCNGKSEVLGLPLQWNDLASWTQGIKDEAKKIDSRKLGKWKWSEVLLESDVDGFFTKLMEKGYFLDGGEKIANPNLGMEIGRDYVKGAANAWDTVVAEEKWTERIELVEEEKIVASGQTGDVGYSHSTYLRTTKSSQLPLLKNVHGCQDDWSEQYGWCWGCFSHEINTHGGSGTEFKCSGYFQPTEDTNIEFFLKKNDKIEREIATCKAGVKYEVILRRTETTIDIYFKSVEKKIIRESHFEEKKTTTQEIDEEKLENEITEEIENLEGETENEENMEKEAGEGGIGAGLEKEKERESEEEDEEENEQEEEQEKENEREDEREKEEEKESENEDEKTEEEKKENEGENEDEN